MKTEAAITVAVENGIAETASKAVYASSAATVIANLTIGEWAALIGIGATVATFAANLFFRLRSDRRDQELHQRRMKAPAPRPKKKESLL